MKIGSLILRAPDGAESGGGAVAAPDAAATPPPAAEQHAAAYAELDALDKPEDGSQKPAAKPDEPPAAKPATPPPAAPPSASKPAEPEKPPVRAAELRTAYEGAKTKIASLEQELATLRSAKPPEDKEKPALIETLTAREKRIAELEEEFKYVDYTKSTEYLEKYQKPYEDAYKTGLADATELSRTDADGVEKAITPEEFWNIVKLPTSQAIKAARELFGEDAISAGILLDRRKSIVAAFQRAETAKAEFKKTGAEREQQRVAQTAQQQAQQQAQAQKIGQERAAMFQQLNVEAQTKYPDWFTPPTDPTEKEIYDKGFAIADKAFGPTNGMPPEEVIRLHSALRNKAGAFPVIVHRLNAAKTEIASLKQELAQFKASGPGTGGTGKGGAGAKPTTYEEEIDALNRA